MTVKEYIEIHYNEIQRKVRAVTKGHECSDDLLNDLIINLLEKSADYHQDLLVQGKIQHWIIKSAYTQFNSSTSPFHLTYRKPNVEFGEKHEEYIDTPDTGSHYKKDMEEDIKLYIGKLPIDQRTYAERHFIEGVSQRKMSKEYGINRIHIGNDLGNIKKNIRTQFSITQYKKRYE